MWEFIGGLRLSFVRAQKRECLRKGTKEVWCLDSIYKEMNFNFENEQFCVRFKEKKNIFVIHLMELNKKKNKGKIKSCP